MIFSSVVMKMDEERRCLLIVCLLLVAVPVCMACK